MLLYFDNMMHSSRKRIILLLLSLAIVGGGIFIFAYYLNYTFHPYCLRLGYTLCAAVGEDFYSLYQSTFNFFHNYFIYGKAASLNLVTPYFMPFKYLPATPLLVGWSFTFFSNANRAYRLFLWISVFLHLFSLWVLYLIGKKLKAKPIDIILVIFIWLSYFSLLSNWRMGQFNHLSALFFLWTIGAVLYKRKIAAALNWTISIAWKPVPILALPYFWWTKNKQALILFFFLFVLFTLIYLSYWQLYYPGAVKEFFRTILLRGNRLPLQVHYIDNFGVYSLLGEIFFDHWRKVWNVISFVYPYLILLWYGWVTIKVKLKNKTRSLSLPKEGEIYYLLFSLATILIWHKELWESWLVFWLPIIVLLLLLAKQPKEKLFILLNTIFLATPSLYYFQQLHPLPIWRLALIAEKAIPQLLLYIFLSWKLLLQREKRRHCERSEAIS